MEVVSGGYMKKKEAGAWKADLVGYYNDRCRYEFALARIVWGAP